MQKRWVYKTFPDTKCIDTLAFELNINKTLAGILASRGILNFEDAKKFFRPNLDHLHDPFLMKDMEKAVIRIENAISAKEKILIYGDYDVDGTTAVSLVYSFFKNISEHTGYYIPNRYTEGYGISTTGVDWAFENGYTLIIALDCGIKAIEKVKYAKQKGIDFIICDHHLPGSEIPDACAILNPKQKKCEYPYKELSGCGIGFKLVCGYALKNKIPFDSLQKYLDLIAASIASDIVPISGENRVLAYFGLKQINNFPRPGIKALLDLAKKKGKLNITDLVFIIGPRINAAGRIADGKNAVQLLISPNIDIAIEKGLVVNDNNTQRKSFDTDITFEALAIIHEDQNLQKSKSTVLFNPGWHKGVVGIVASRIIEKHYRPTIILTQTNGHATGSARTVDGFDIYTAIDACKDLLVNYGGHKFAAGLTMKVENVKEFQHRFEAVVSSTITEDQLIPSIKIDSEMDLNSISPKFYNILKQFEPFGPDNMCPVFMTKNLEAIPNSARVVGENHLKFKVRKNGSAVFEAIAFQQAEKLDLIKTGQFDACYTISENEWNGKVTLQLEMKDIRHAS